MNLVAYIKIFSLSVLPVAKKKVPESSFRILGAAELLFFCKGLSDTHSLSYVSYFPAGRTHLPVSASLELQSGINFTTHFLILSQPFSPPRPLNSLIQRCQRDLRGGCVST